MQKIRRIYENKKFEITESRCIMCNVASIFSKMNRH